jgi:hypothetical protein
VTEAYAINLALEGERDALLETLKPFGAAILPCDDCLSGWQFGTRPKTEHYIAAREALSSSEHT